MRVFRWEVPVDDRDHKIGAGKVLHVATRRDIVVEVWTEEDAPADELILPTRRATAIGTGYEVPEDMVHLGSTLTSSGYFVWHLYGEA